MDEEPAVRIWSAKAHPVVKLVHDFPDRLPQVGQSLRVPATGTASGTTVARSASRSHRVERGQTLTHIARRYGVSLERLRAANGLRGSSLRPGQVLRIPQGG